MQPAEHNLNRSSGNLFLSAATLPKLFYLSCLLAMATLGLRTVAYADGPTTARRASDFLDSIGVNSAINQRGERLQKTAECIPFPRGRRIRSGIEGNPSLQDLLDLHAQTGVRYSWCPGSGGSDLEKLLSTARPLAKAGALLAFEGPNEPNNWGITYQGQAGGRNQSWVPVASLQSDLYNAVKSDPVLKKVPVWTITEGGAETDNVGLQFLNIPRGAGTVMPDGTRYADYANVHNNSYHPQPP